MLTLNSIKTTIALMSGAIAISLSIVPQADAATVRRTFTVNASQSGNGFFEYDDAALNSGLFGSFTDILLAEFAFDGESQQTVNDPFGAVNFDNNGNFLGIDLEIIPPASSTLQSVLIANNDVYIPIPDPFDLDPLPEDGAFVTYGDVDGAAGIPTPALLPGLVALGAQTLRKRKQDQQAS